jgi:putative NADPH-quinone reductase
MKKVMLLLAHPAPGSFNHAVAKAAAAALAAAGREVLFHDLYAEGFDPVLPESEIPQGADLPGEIARHCSEIREAEGVVVVHPNWWGQPPAILKGWVDRVIRPGVAYEFVEGDAGEGVPRGLLKGKKAMVFNTANTSRERERTVFNDPLELLWKNCIFGLCGIHDVYRRMFSIVVTSTGEERRAWLREVADAVQKTFPPESP